MTSEITGSFGPLVPRQSVPATRQASTTPPDTKTTGPTAADKDPLLHKLSKDPLLGEPFVLLSGGADVDRVLLPLMTILNQAPVEELKQSYQKAREALTNLLYDPNSDPQKRAAASHLVSVTMEALRRKGFDPLNPGEPSIVRFDRDNP